jgi:peptidoglycan/LPS O-acetylase OafA/YrhL
VSSGLTTPALHSVSQKLSRHIPELDGVRGLAILWVIAFHARAVYTNSSEIPLPLFRALDLGWSGVDLFFVLSGFLITGILLNTRESPSYFRAFYARRALRIFPLYFIYVLSVIFLVRPLYIHLVHVDEWSTTHVWWYCTYLLNWKKDHGFDDLYLGHLWSLAIEEQFYFVWPAVVWLCPRKALPWVCVALAVACAGLRVILYTRGVWPEAIYRLTPTRMDGLALGSLTALAVRFFRERWERWIFPVAAISAFGLLYVLSRSQAFYWGDPLMACLGTPLLVVLFACLVFAAATSASPILARCLRVPFLRTAGKYSYAMYVLHSIPYNITIDWLRNWLHGKDVGTAIFFKALYIPALMLIALIAGWLSWHLLEKRFLALRTRFSYD